MAILHNLVDTDLLERLSHQDLHPLYLERVPSPREISNFFYSLELYCDPYPLWSRFFISPRDGSVSIGHTPQLPHHSPVIPYELHVVTSVHDYTFRSLSPYTSQWDRPIRVGNPALIPTVLALFDPLEQHILSARPHYLHFIHHVTAPGKLDSFTVEVARRVKTTREPDIGSASIEKWPGQLDENGKPDRSRRPASRTDITLWAVLYLVDPDPALDMLRLANVRAAISTVSPPSTTHPLSQQHSQQQNQHQAFPNVELRGFNLAAVLRSRPASYRDGRARFPLISSVVSDQSLLRPSSPAAVPSAWGPGRQPRFELPQSARPVVQPAVPPEHQSNILTAGCVIAAAVAVPALGFLTLLRLRDAEGGEKNEVAGLALTLFFNLLPISFFCALHVMLGPQMTVAHLLRRRRESTAGELLQWAERQPSGSGARVAAVRTSAGRRHWDGEGLSFAGGRFEGASTFDGARFRVSELLDAGFQTGFTVGGREVLVTPEGERLVLRGVGKDGRGVFDQLVEGEDVEGRFVNERRARWWSDVEVGYQKDLGDRR